MKRKKTIVWVLSFVMAFTVFGMMGASGAYGAEGSKGFTVTVNYTDGVSTNERVIKKTTPRRTLSKWPGIPRPAWAPGPIRSTTWSARATMSE